MESQEEIKKQILNQLKAFDSYYNKRKRFIGIRTEKKIDKYLSKIKRVLGDK